MSNTQQDRGNVDKMDKTVEKSFRLMKAVYTEKHDKVTEKKNSRQTPITPPRTMPPYSRQEQNIEEDADSEESQGETTKERRRRRTKRREDLEPR